MTHPAPPGRPSVIEKYLAKYFVGDAFNDALFNEDNNAREIACSWKIMSSLMLFSELTARTYEMCLWRAVGIPLHLADGALQGDVDLMFALRRGEHRGGHLTFTGPIYRCFELKTSKVTKAGDVKSLKQSKFYKTKAQLEKLCRVGAPEVYLLEAFIVEAGFSNVSPDMPTTVRASVSAKYDQIVGANFGYVTLPIEQMFGFDGEHTLTLWPAQVVKRASNEQLRQPFENLVSVVEGYRRTAGLAAGYDPVVTYCYDCRNLTWAHPRGPYICNRCGSPLI